MRLQLLGGSYLTRSNIASAVQSVNLFPEINPQGAVAQQTLYQRPGLRWVSSPSQPGPGRGIWQLSNGTCFCVVGPNVYIIGQPPTFTQTYIGSITPGLTNPCSCVDNGTNPGGAILVDGSVNGWTFSIVDGSGFAQIVDPTGIFQGANKVDYIDTFVLWNLPGSRNFGSTLSNEITFNNTYFAAKTDWPDPLQTLIVNQHFIMLLGLFKTEVWFDAGNAQFPFAELPGSLIEHGIAAIYSLASTDISIFWLGRDLQGQGVVFRYRGYQCSRISNHALEYAIRQFYINGITIADAVAFTFQQDGHVFYVLSFPTGNQTWVFDDATGEWVQWASYNGPNAMSVFARSRGVLGAACYGYNLVQDYATGDLLMLDPNYYYDDVEGVFQPIRYMRTFQHFAEASAMGAGRTDQLIHFPSNGKRIRFTRFQLDMECGTTDNGPFPNEILLRWSDDRGKTFGNIVAQSAGKLGEFNIFPQWQNLGIARDRIWEVSYSIPGPAAIQGAWVDCELEQS